MVVVIMVLVFVLVAVVCAHAPILPCSCCPTG
jgi:hypothetical protein